MRQLVVFEGFGGQGTKSAGDLIVAALFHQGVRVQGMPMFEPLQMGGIVTYFISIDSDGDRVIPTHDRDAYVMMHNRLFTERHALTVRPGGIVLINAPDVPPHLQAADRAMAVIDGDMIARQHRLVKANVPNISTVMAGAFARISGVVALESLEQATRELFPKSVSDNLHALRAGYDRVAMGKTANSRQVALLESLGS